MSWNCASGTDVFANVSSMSVTVNECHVREMDETRGRQKKRPRKNVMRYGKKRVISRCHCFEISVVQNNCESRKFPIVLQSHINPKRYVKKTVEKLSRCAIVLKLAEIFETTIYRKNSECRKSAEWNIISKICYREIFHLRYGKCLIFNY